MRLLFNCLTKKYADFDGRSSRKEFALFIIAFILIEIILLLFFILCTNKESVIYLIIYSVYVLVRVYSFIPNIAVITRRLHDTNNSGWWQLAMILPLGQILIFVLFFLKGTKGENKYGEPPQE